MQRWIRLGSTVAVTSLLFAGLALGAEETTKSPTQKPEAKWQSGEKTGAMSGQHAYQPELRRISKLQDTKLTDQKGQDFGTIKNMIIDVDHGCVAYAVVARGGVLGIGAKDALLPFSLIREKNDSTKLWTKATPEQFKQAEGFDAGNAEQVRKLSDAAYAERFSQEFGVRPYWERMSHSPQMKQEKTNSGEKSSSESPQASGEKATQRGPGEMVVATTLLSWGGADVKTKEGSVDVGDLDDLMVDLHGGHIAYAIVDREHELVPSNQLCAVPWSLIQLQRAEPRPNLIVDLSAAKIKEAPGFENAHWPDMAKADWEDRVNGYYGSKPYYAVYGYMMTPEEWTPESFSQRPVQTLEGTIESINQNARGPGLTRPGCQVSLKVEKNQTPSGQIKEGQTVQVNLAPEHFLKSKSIDLKQGGKLTVTGFVTSWQHAEQTHTAVVARDINFNGKSYSLRNHQGQPEWSTQESGWQK